MYSIYEGMLVLEFEQNRETLPTRSRYSVSTVSLGHTGFFLLFTARIFVTVLVGGEKILFSHLVESKVVFYTCF